MGIATVVVWHEMDLSIGYVGRPLERPSKTSPCEHIYEVTDLGGPRKTSNPKPPKQNKLGVKRFKKFSISMSDEGKWLFFSFLASCALRT